MAGLPTQACFFFAKTTKKKKNATGAASVSLVPFFPLLLFFPSLFSLLSPPFPSQNDWPQGPNPRRRQRLSYSNSMRLYDRSLPFLSFFPSSFPSFFAPSHPPARVRQATKPGQRELWHAMSSIGMSRCIQDSFFFFLSFLRFCLPAVGRISEEYSPSNGTNRYCGPSPLPYYCPLFSFSSLPKLFSCRNDLQRVLE